MNAQIQEISPPKPEAEPEQLKDSSHKSMANDDNTSQIVRPWVRYWARFVDNAVWGFVLSIPLSFVYLDLGEGTTPFGPFLVNISVFFLYTFIEALLLSTWGTTLGKALLRVQLRKYDGNKPSYGEAWLRSLKVFVKGLGLAIPIFALFTLMNAQGDLSNNLSTSWDREGGFIVTHHHIGKLRIGVVIVIFLILIGLQVQRSRFGY